MPICVRRTIPPPAPSEAVLAPSWQRRLQAAAQARAQQHARRRLWEVQQRCGVRVRVDGDELLDFAGNDYLGLASTPALVAALREAAPLGVGASASHLVSGHHAAHAALERDLAQWLNAPRALLLGSGFAANLAVLQGLLGSDDVCVQDRLNHASLIDGARLAGCELRRYPHADAEAAQRQLARAPDRGLTFLASDGVFSMDGDVAPLPALAAACAQHDALLYIDEAHALGVLGTDGAGSVAAAGLDTAAVPLRLCTLGKALGCYGAALVGDGDVIEHLLQTARPYIYTTALPPALAETARASVALAQRGDALRAALRARIAQFRDGAAQRGLSLLDSHTPIQPLPIGDNARTLAVAQALRARGYWVGAIRPPTVPLGQARLRITLSAAHAPEHVEGLLAALTQVLAETADVH
jgi:8-amino-7-oxononanoate synthase